MPNDHAPTAAASLPRLSAIRIRSTPTAAPVSRARSFIRMSSYAWRTLALAVLGVMLVLLYALLLLQVVLVRMVYHA